MDTGNLQAEKVTASEWAYDRIKKSFELLSQDETEKTEHCGKRSLRQLEDKEESQCLTCARTVTVSLWKTTFVGSPVRTTHEVVVRNLWREVRLEAMSNRHSSRANR